MIVNGCNAISDIWTIPNRYNCTDCKVYPVGVDFPDAERHRRAIIDRPYGVAPPNVGNGHRPFRGTDRNNRICLANPYNIAHLFRRACGIAHADQPGISPGRKRRTSRKLPRHCEGHRPVAIPSIFRGVPWTTGLPRRLSAPRNDVVFDGWSFLSGQGNCRYLVGGVVLRAANP